MARNKHPEETVQRILTTASKLFLEKGYEKTSLQDIIRETGLSKGAIYHHFSSKEAIFETICNQIGQENEIRLSKIRDDAALTGEEKLRKIFRSAILHPNQKEAFHIPSPVCSESGSSPAGQYDSPQQLLICCSGGPYPQNTSNK